MSRREAGEKKRRVPTIGLDSGRDVVVTAIKNGPDSSIEFFGEDGQRFYPADAWVDIGYERENKKRKVVTRIWTGPCMIHRDPHDALRRFDHLLAIDTNTAAGNVGLTACSFSTLERKSGSLDAHVIDQPILEFHGGRGVLERIGWWAMITAVAHVMQIEGMDFNVGVVVDHELNDIMAMNRRESPIIDDFLLPSGFELIFATADKTDFLCNKLIRRCDLRADRVKRALSRGEVSGELQRFSGGYYSHSRHWPVA